MTQIYHHWLILGKQKILTIIKTELTFEYHVIATVEKFQIHLR